MAGVSPRTAASIAAGGGRHYKGRGLGALQAWKCVSCGTENGGPLKDGCVSCGAGKPGTQVRQKHEPVPDGAAKVGGSNSGRPDRNAPTGLTPPTPTPRGAASAGGLRIQGPRAVTVDYDEIERRIARLLEQRLGGGFSEVERATLYLALTVYIGAWEDGLIEPNEGLTLDKARELAARVAPDDISPFDAVAAGPAEIEEAEEHGNAETETEGSNDGDQAGSDRGGEPAAPGYDDDGGEPRPDPGAPERPAPE